MKNGDNGGDAEPIGIRRFGVGTKARIAALRVADELRSGGVVAVALFKPSMGGWVVAVYPGRIRQRH